MKSILKAVKCSGERCKEVFHICENYEPGGLYDLGYVAVKCHKCGAITRIRMKNPPKFGYYDNFEIVGGWEEGEANKYDECPIGNNAIVIGKEPSERPIPVFSYDESLPLYYNDKTNFELIALLHLRKCIKDISSEINGFKQAYLADQFITQGVERCFVSQKYTYKGEKYNALWCKIFRSEKSMTTKGLFLIDHDHCNSQIDGVFSRNQMMSYLKRCLLRWKMIASQVIVVTPFIGFDFNFSKEEDKKEIIALWEVLNGLLDINKTWFVTRMTSYSSLKKYQKEFDVPADVLKEWDLMDNLQKMFDNPKTRIKPKAQFHAKLYAGVFYDHVELLSGSYNFQTGEVLEQMCLRKVSKELFKQNYLNRLVDGFEYIDNYNPKSLHINVDEEGKVNSKIEEMLF